MLLLGDEGMDTTQRRDTLELDGAGSHARQGNVADRRSHVVA